MSSVSLLKKLPSLEQTAQVFAVIAMIEYSWAFLRFFYRFPSWLFFSSVGEIGVFFSYMIIVNLLGSVLLLAIFMILGLILPRDWFVERFVSLSVSLTLLGMGYLIYINWYFPSVDSYPLASYTHILTVLAIIIMLAFLIDRVAFLRDLLKGFANRMVVFLYLLLPVSAIALLVVVFRNLV